MARVPRSELLQVKPTQSIRLDRALEDVVAKPVDHVTRVELSRVAADIALKIGRPGGLDPPSLSAAVFDFIMPRLREPGILVLERRMAVLGRLLDEARSAGDEHALSGGLMALRQELKSLNTLRANRDSLIEG